jgi:hypothetical protein
MKRDELSGVKTVHSLLAGLLGALITLPVVMIFVFLLYIFKGIHIPTWGIFPISASIATNNSFVNNPNGLFIMDLKGTIGFSNPPFLISLYFILQTLLTFLSMYYIVFLLRKITGSVIAGNPFIKQNPKRLRIIAAILIAVPYFIAFCNFLITRKLISSLNIHNLLLSPLLEIDTKVYISVLAGMLSIVFSTVLKSAIKIKEENELTV